MNIFDMIAATVSPQAQANVQAERMLAAGPKLPAPMSMDEMYAYAGDDPARAERARKVAQMRATEMRMQQPVTTTQPGIEIEKQLLSDRAPANTGRPVMDLVHGLVGMHGSLNAALGGGDPNVPLEQARQKMGGRVAPQAYSRPQVINNPFVR